MEYLLFGGKGGVGKTTCAAATGLALARTDRETLMVSTDPAHSIADAFETPVGDDPTAIAAGLDAVETDPTAGTERYRRLFEAVAADLDDAGIDLDAADVQDLFSSGELPGSDELAALESFATYLEADYDVVVFDTAPTGHTLRLLDLPDAVGTGVRTALSLREQVRRKTTAAKTMVMGPYAALGRRVDEDEAAAFDELVAEMEAVESVLRDPERTSFRVVCTPERMVLAETERLVDQLRTFEVPVGQVLVNRVLEDPNPDCDRCQGQFDRQQRVLEDIEAAFPALPVGHLPDLTGVAAGRAAVDRIADRIEAAELEG
ncbi:ArsA family ATPase [Halobacteriales archaeon Cl-PHB]